MADELKIGPARTNPDKSEDTKSAGTHYSPDAPDADVESRAGVGQAGRTATGPSAPLHHLKGAKISGRPNRGTISPGIGYLYVLGAMFMMIGAGTLLSGGFVPVDPNGPGGPPTLDPYFNPEDYGEQKKIYPSNANRPEDNNLQLKTFKVNTCGQKTAIDFLIDTSGSMKYDGKVGKQKTALKAIVKKLTAKSVVGIHTFSKSAKEEVPMGLYKDNKADIDKTIESLKPDGWTTTREGFSLVKQKLTELIATDKYPGYSYAVILLTDGVPEQPAPRSCWPDNSFQPFDPQYQANRCFSIEQDPRKPTDLAGDLKSMGVKVYSVGIFSQTTTDKLFYPHLSGMLKDVASGPGEPYYYESIEGGNLEKILNDVLNQICEEQGAI